jgi:hypothetical protein
MGRARPACTACPDYLHRSLLDLPEAARLAELYEVVLALGFLTWKTSGEREVKRHIVTAQANLEFDAKRGVLTVGMGAEGAKLRLEQDMLDPLDQPSPEHQNAFQKELAEAGDDVWTGSRVKAVVEGWITALRSTSRFEDTLDRQRTADSTPRMHFAPALILRRRTERSLIQVFENIKKNLEQGGLLPRGVQRLVSIVEDHDNDPRELGTSGSDHPAEKEIYFPLPANDEQLRIVRRLSAKTGVLVQGPPGTGKSHTIANLISHLLATGNRILVTSQTPRALRVLRTKIPAAVKPLCVSLLATTAMRWLPLTIQSGESLTDRYLGTMANPSWRYNASKPNSIRHADGKPKACQACAQSGNRKRTFIINRADTTELQRRSRGSYAPTQHHSTGSKTIPWTMRSRLSRMTRQPNYLRY